MSDNEGSEDAGGKDDIKKQLNRIQNEQQIELMMNP